MKLPNRATRLAPLLFSTAALVVGIFMISCGGKQEARTPAAADRNAPATQASAKPLPVDMTTVGSVTGTIKFDGAPPKMKAIDMKEDAPECARQHSSPAITEDVVLGDNGTLQNVVVYLQGDFSRYSFAQATAPVTIDQKGCIYAPHVTALMTGEPLRVVNSDPISHNVNAISKQRQSWNETQESGAMPVERSFAHEEIAIPVKCNWHTWMKFYVAVLSHPYFQVTGKKGSFALKNVPPGTYRLVAWHELYGMKEQDIVIQPKQEQTVSITFTDHDRP